MTEDEIDASFDLPYTRLPHPKYDKRGAIPAFEMIKFSMLTFVVSPSKIKRKFLRVLLCVLFRSSFSTGPIWMWSGIRPCLIRSLIFFTLCRWSAEAPVIEGHSIWHC